VPSFKFHLGCACSSELAELKSSIAAIQAALNTLITQGEKLMATEQAALDLLTKIDAATTKQAAALTQEAATLQTISDEIDGLIAQAKASGGVPDSVIAALQAQSDKVAAVSDSIDTQAAFSTSIASKGIANPVPIPVPPATPPAPPAPGV
jgi:chromosome segregation ATPase